MKNYNLQFLEANNSANDSIKEIKRPSRDLNPSRSLDSLGATVQDFKL